MNAVRFGHNLKPNFRNKYVSIGLESQRVHFLMADGSYNELSFNTFITMYIPKTVAYSLGKESRVNCGDSS